MLKRTITPDLTQDANPEVAETSGRPRLVAFFDLGHSAACDGFENLLPLAEDRAGAEQMAEAVKWTARRSYSMKNSRKKRYNIFHAIKAAFEP